MASIVKNHTAANDFRRRMQRPASASRRYQFMLDYTLVMTLMAGTLYVTDNTRFALFYSILFIVTQVNSGYFAWLTPRPGAGLRGRPEQNR